MQVVTRLLDKQTVRFEALVYEIGQEKARQVFYRSINHSTAKAYTAVNRQIRTQTSIKVSDVKKAVNWHRASRRTLRAVIRATGAHISLRYFGPKQFKYGVRARVWGRSQRFPSAFMVASLGNTVFKNTRGFNRKSGRNNAIEKLWGPSIPKELLTDAVVAAFEDRTDDIAERAAHELQRIIDKT